MIPVLNNNEAFLLDSNTIQSGYLDTKELINNAGIKISQFIVENILDPFNSKLIIMVGCGNNGADGIACHYYLRNYGINSNLLLFDREILNSWFFKEYKIENDHIYFYSNSFCFNKYNWIIDSIFGIGLKRNIKDQYKRVIKQTNQFENIISIDIPSGIFTNNGNIAGVSIKAKYTLAIGYKKLGHFFNDGLKYSGKIITIDIGFENRYLNSGYCKLIEKQDAKISMPQNSIDNYKYKRGKVFTICGSSGYSGACILAVKAAIKSGAGISKVLINNSNITSIDQKLIESIKIPISDDIIGKTDHKSLIKIINFIKWGDSLIFGPGLENDIFNSVWMAKILKKIDLKLILDASGFKPLIDSIISIKDLPQETILTPHYAEFSRIFNLDINYVQNDPISCIKSIIPALRGRVMILKGPTNIIISTSGDIYFMDHGTSMLATAGSGDVLTGILSASLAQGSDINDAAIYSTYMHAECARQYANKINNNGLIASDLIEMIPYAMKSINDIY